MNQPIRLLFTLTAVVLCIAVIWITGRISLSRIFGRYAIATAIIPVATESARLAPSDSDAHMVQALLLTNAGTTGQGIAEFERAVALRPRDYDLWLKLAMARDENDDSDGALAAFNEAVRYAPYYGQPRWQRGNLLLRMHRYNEAFDDLRAAAASSPDFVPALIDLSWSFSGGDVKIAEQLAQSNTPEMRIAYARYLARRGKGREAVEFYKAGGSVSEEVKNEMVGQLIARQDYVSAYQIWRGADATNSSESLSIYDGGFEGPLQLNATGFGWHIDRNLKGVGLSLDSEQPHSGSKSLRIEFNGESSPETPIITQLFLVEPSMTYRISFTSRAKDIVTGGLPVVVIMDASGEHKILGQSVPIPNTTSAWQSQEFAFTTQANTSAVFLTLKRQNCSTSPCPAFGTLWVDSFGIAR